MARPRRFPAATIHSLTKTCSKCAVERTISQYHKDKNATDGLASTCSVCTRARWSEKYKDKESRKKRYQQQVACALAKERPPEKIKTIGGKKCSICEQIKPWASFQKKNTSLDGTKAACKECSNKAYKEWRHNRQSLPSKKWNIKKNYGLTWDDYQALLLSQKGLCEICQCDMSKVRQGPCIDHCHETGIVRGLLCAWCNRGLGLFKDNPEYLVMAATYVSKWGDIE